MKKLSILGALMVSVMMFLAPSFALVTVHAQSNGCTTGQDCAQKGLDDVGQAFPAGAKRAVDVPTTIHLIINWALYLAAIIAVIFIIIGGYYYITSAGNEGQATKGKTTLVNALIGLTIVVMSYLIVQIVYNFLTK